MKSFFYIIFFIFISYNSHSSTKPPFDNIITLSEPKKYEELIFEDSYGKIIKLENITSKYYIFNFWATWCAPCRKEMPSLDRIQLEENIEVFAINIEAKNLNKINKFLNDLNIKNLSIYFDKDLNLINQFKLRGIPTTIILNNKRQEIARILGELDFNNPDFIKWLKEQ